MRLAEAISTFTFRGVLDGERLTDPQRLRDQVARNLVLATSARAAHVMAAAMPNTIKGVNPDIVIFESLAFTVPTLCQGVSTQHKAHRGDSLFSLIHEISSSRFILRGLVEKFGAETWGDVWWSRFLEYHKERDLQERFSFLGYSLECAINASTPMSRYPGSAPVSLRFDTMLEGVSGYVAVSEVYLKAAQLAVELANILPEAPDPCTAEVE